jgi:hypothetical protein
MPRLERPTITKTSINGLQQNSNQQKIVNNNQQKIINNNQQKMMNNNQQITENKNSKQDEEDTVSRSASKKPRFV